jgi:hypothetical protein
VLWNGIGSSSKGKKMCKMTQGSSSQERKGQVQIYYKLISEGKTANQQCYLEVLTRLRESVQRKTPNSSLTSGFCAMTMPLRMMH